MGLAPHGCDVAEAPRQRLPAGVFGAMGVSAEVHALDQQISRKKEVLPGASGTENRAIIADSEDDPTAALPSQFAPDSLN
jgi:hypothetical protein